MADNEETTFGTELWSHLDQVDTYMATGVEYHLALNEFVKGYAQAELEYAAQLLKIAKPFRDAISKSKEKWQKANDPALAKQVTVNYSSTVMTAWERLLAQTEDVAAFHFEISEVMNKERKDVKGTASQLHVHTKQNFEKIKLSQIELTKLLDTMEKNQHSYEKELKALDTGGAYLKKCVKEKREKEMDKSRMEFEKQVAAVKHSLFFYKTSVETVNSAKHKHYTSTIPDVLNEIQKEDESTRIELTKNTMVNIADAIVSTLPKETQIWSNFGELARKIDPEYDSGLLMAAFKTGDNAPVDFSHLDTHDTLKKKLALLTENNYKAEDHEDLGNPHIPQKQGKKKAAERIKSIDKETVELDKKRQGLGVIVSTLSELPHSESALQEIYVHKSDIEVKMNALALKKQFFLEYIADADGKPRPPPPTLLTHDSSLSPTKKAASMASLRSPVNEMTIVKSPTKTDSPLMKSTTAADLPPVDTPSDNIPNSDKIDALFISTSEFSATPPVGKGLPEATVGGGDGDLFGSYVNNLIRDADRKKSVLATSVPAETPATIVKPQTHPLIPSSSGLFPVQVYEKVEMLYDFDAAPESPEISVKAGTKMELVELEAGDGWARCRTVEGPALEGLVPRAYIGK